MSNATQRMICRWVHIVFGIPVIGYIYTPFDALAGFAWMVRLIFLPILILSGLWMWKGHLVRRLNSREPG